MPKPPKRSQEEILLDLSKPAAFASNVLGINLYDWQRKVLRDLEAKDCRVALRAANGSGKTSTVISAILIWHALVYPRSIAVTTAGVFRQVESQLWPSLRNHIAKLGGAWEVTSGEIRYLHPNGNTSRIIGYSATDPGRAEGWHAEDHEYHPLLMVVDEAKTVADPLFEAISRCQPTRLLIASSPGGTSGAFYRAFTKEANMWSKHAVTAFDCPHITQKQIDEITQRYGEKHPLTRSMIYGEFVDIGAESLVINLNQLQNCYNAPPRFKPGVRTAGVDFAAGGDQNVICISDGNKILPMIAWREKDTMAAVGRFIIEFKKAGLEASNIYADASGMGMVMCDALAESGWAVNRVNFGATAYDNNAYTNRSAEMWYNMAKKIEDAEIILPEDDEDLTAQLTCRRTITNSKGKLGVESKDSMRARGIASPDRADALALCVSGANIGLDLTFQIERPTWKSLQEMMVAHDPVMSGFDAGG
jgi:phage terminase large subunit